MNIRIAESDLEIESCFAVMRKLRPHLRAEAFVDQVRRQNLQGYRIAFLEVGGRPVATAGYRILENLAWGKFLYVDDLVTISTARSSGYGAALLEWLRKTAVGEGCSQLHLDSGVQRFDAHRFYDREGMARTCIHFASVLGTIDP